MMRDSPHVGRRSEPVRESLAAPGSASRPSIDPVCKWRTGKRRAADVAECGPQSGAPVHAAVRRLGDILLRSVLRMRAGDFLYSHGFAPRRNRGCPGLHPLPGRIVTSAPVPAAAGGGGSFMGRGGTLPASCAAASLAPGAGRAPAAAVRSAGSGACRDGDAAPPLHAEPGRTLLMPTAQRCRTARPAEGRGGAHPSIRAPRSPPSLQLFKRPACGPTHEHGGWGSSRTQPRALMHAAVAAAAVAARRRVPAPLHSTVRAPAPRAPQPPLRAASALARSRRGTGGDRPGLRSHLRRQWPLLP